MELRQLTTLRTGGTPTLYFHPGDAGELRAALAECRRRGLPWRVLGGGSNLLVDEGPLPYAVIHICSPGFDSIERSGPNALRVGAGLPMARLLGRCRRAGLAGLEFLGGLPGTVGGALAGNAGAWGATVSDRLTRLHVMSPGGEHRALDRDQVGFAYRQCRLADGVVTGAEFELEPRDPELIAAHMAECVRRRVERHPPGLASAGCVFKNPAGGCAGRMLDLCRMKGQSAGDAAVSNRHANFIVNNGHATAGDVLLLIERMRRAVHQRFGIDLELEVRHWVARGRVA